MAQVHLLRATAFAAHRFQHEVAQAGPALAFGCDTKTVHRKAQVHRADHGFTVTHIRDQGAQTFGPGAGDFVFIPGSAAGVKVGTAHLGLHPAGPAP